MPDDAPPAPPAAPAPGRYPVRFGTAELMADLDRPNGWMLAVDGVFQSYVDLEDPTYLDFGYLHHVGAVLDVVGGYGEPLDAVHLGAGAGTLPRYVAATRPGSAQVVVDLDGPLLDLAWHTLGLRTVEGVTRVEADAREVVEARPDASADLVVVDVFTAGSVPPHVATAEFAAQVARVLRPDGVCVVNLADTGALDFARRQVAAWRDALGEVLLLAEPSVLRGRRHGNVVLTASRRALPLGPVVRGAASSTFAARVVHGQALDALVGDAVAPHDGEEVHSPPLPPGTLGDALYAGREADETRGPADA
jgi:SAM-dependent methyltransferase